MYLTKWQNTGYHALTWEEANAPYIRQEHVDRLHRADATSLSVKRAHRVRGGEGGDWEGSDWEGGDWEGSDWEGGDWEGGDWEGGDWEGVCPRLCADGLTLSFYPIPTPHPPFPEADVCDAAEDRGLRRAAAVYPPHAPRLPAGGGQLDGAQLAQRPLVHPCR